MLLGATAYSREEINVHMIDMMVPYDHIICNPIHLEAEASPSPRINTESERKEEIVKQSLEQSDESPRISR